MHHQRGSHIVLKHPERREVRIVVPCHGSRSVAPGTLHRILRDEGLTGDRPRELM
ncbi:MAG: type II toxin-antitoxin system HicA family toxin [Planctomycetes bacterium]|nr:type II toxin-antitoxin system HicA family toxin [Planctomycetota bacterium]